MSYYNIPTISTGFVEDYLLQLNFSQQELLKAAGFSIDVSLAVLKNLPYSNLLKLYEWASIELDNPHWGLVLGDSCDSTDFGPVGLMAYKSSTLRDFFETLNKYQSLISSGFNIDFKEGAFESQFCFHLILPNQPGTKVEIDTTFSIIINMIRDCFNDKWLPLRTEVFYCQPENSSPLEQYYGENVFFDQPDNCLVIETSLLDLPINNGDPKLLALLKDEISHLFAKSNNEDNLLSKVRTCTAAMLGTDQFNSANIARQLNMSQRSLVRHLSTFDTSLREIKAETIEKMSKTALRETQSSIFEIALQMGFSETCAFTRMFKTKTGFTPQQYREKVTSDLGRLLN